MPIDTHHPDYAHFSKRWRKVSDALGDEDQIKARGEAYLDKPQGMAKNDPDGTAYDAYKGRARFPEVTQQALTGIVGLVFEQDPIGASDAVITNGGQTNLELSRDMIRACAAKGRDILVVDAPPKRKGGGGGGRPFITRYAAEALINWKTSPTNPRELTLAVFEEAEDAADDMYGHETTTTYRRYFREGAGPVEVTRWKRENERDIRLGAPVLLPVPFMPIVIAGSIDTSPACDPVPLMPVVFSALAYYRKSASYEQALYLTAQPTPWVSGADETLYQAILEQGIGSSVLWPVPEGGQVGFLEISAEGISELQQALAEEMRQAESHAVRLTQQSDGVESAASIGMRAATQHASVYSVADAVSIAITRAQRMRAEWAAETAPAEDFALRTDFTEAYAGEKMIAVLNQAINAGNAPRSPMFEAIRRSGLSEKTDAEMEEEIAATGALFLGEERPPLQLAA